MSWIEKILPPRIQPTEGRRRTVPEGVWLKCPSCDAVLYRDDLEKNLEVCPSCAHHMRIKARTRLDQLLDAEGRFEIVEEAQPGGPAGDAGAARAGPGGAPGAPRR